MIYRLSFWKKLKTTFLKPWFESGGCFDFLQQVDDSGLHLVPLFEEFFYVSLGISLCGIRQKCRHTL